VIGVDTNVVLRMFVEDDPAQSHAARTLIGSSDRAGDPILLTPLVLAEVEWSLRSNFDRSKAAILAIFDRILANTAFVISEREAVEAAVGAWRLGKADFADYLISAVAREHGARTTMTFDRKAAVSATFTLLPH
jgi:predicted nucleic-acid-binding protein